MLESDRFLEVDGVPFKLDGKTLRLYRMEGDDLVEIGNSDAASSILFRSGCEISEKKALELAASERRD